MSRKDPGPVPSRWLNCPSKSTDLLVSKFLAFKTPLSNDFNDKVPERNRFTPSMLFNYLKTRKIKLGLWVDLTNTSRFYDKKEIEDQDCKYVKLSCRGHGETPSVQQTNDFIHMVSMFLRQKPLECIGVHCTHGFNRTGFMLASYMVEQCDCNIEMAVSEFARIRPPGIYKQDYLDELYKRYDDIELVPMAPITPDWCNGEDEEDDENEVSNDNATSSQGKPKKHKERTIVKTVFLPEVKNVDPFNEQPKLSDIQKKVQKMCKWKSKGFPGSQPISMDRNNIINLHKKPYRVSWKADGTRFMMLIDGENEVYMIDRDNCVFKVHNLRFVRRKNLTQHLTNTLLDGEMVIDRKGDECFPRYLCYDIVMFDGVNVGKESFHPTRYNCIEQEIVNPRYQAIVEGLINKDEEPFSVRVKQFYELTTAKALLGERFAKQLLHEPDGLIFQPSKEPYVPGQSELVLKWKPASMNSIDFKLKITVEEGVGILRKKICNLYVGQLDKPFGKMKYTKSLADYDNKIIECKYENNQWVMMRERTDKSYPNSFNTATAVLESVQNPVTEEYLLSFINSKRFHDDDDLMRPPNKVARRR